MSQILSVSEATRYLDGFLAAALPGINRAGIEPSPLTARADLALPPAPPPAIPVAETDVSTAERIKRHLHPLDSFPRLLECVEANRPPTPDDQFRFQWFGLFYQAPRQDAFHLRLRLPGGRVRAFQLLGLAEITQKYAAGSVLLNAQGGLDIPGVPLQMAAEILRSVENIGLSTRQTGGDCVQSVRGGEHDDWAGPGMQSGQIYPLVCQLEQALAHSRRLADLPCGCEIVFRSSDETPVISREDSPHVIVVQAASGSKLDHEAHFLLVIPGQSEGGWRLPASRLVSGCLKLLEDWAAGADRTSRQGAGLATYGRTLRHEQINALLGGAEWQPMPRPSETGLAVAGMTPRSGFPVPDGRLLSGQLQRIEQILRERNLSGVRLVRGELFLAPEVDAPTGEAIRRVLDVR